LERKVDTQEAASWAKNNGVLFVETSALTGQGVGEVFEKIGTSFGVVHLCSTCVTHMKFSILTTVTTLCTARELPRGDREDSGRGGVAVASTAPAEQKKCC